MEARVLNENLTAVGIVDNFESFIWTERYRDVGNFELYAAYSQDLLNLIRPGYFISIADSLRLMIVEDIQIKTDIENGNKIIFTGRSLESLLDRRIVLRKILIDSNVQDGYLRLLIDNMTNSIYPERNISTFTYATLPSFPYKALKAQFYGETLLEVILALTEQHNVGFAVLPESYAPYVFRFLVGTDRSYNQSANPYVVFSPTFDNIISSDYYFTNRPKKTYALITGQAPSASPGQPYRGQAWENGINTSGLVRREMHVDANDMTLYPESGSTEISEEEYLAQLNQRGLEELAKQVEVETFEAQIDISDSYTYGVDFNLGDTLQIEDLFGHQLAVQVMEMTFSENLSGYSVYPSLRSI